MTRIIAGEWGGRKLRVPAQGTRPTSERVREAVLNALQHRFESWQDLRVLDLYAGSGALGFEALSRGAAWATFVDNSAAAVKAIRENQRTLNSDQLDVIARDVAVFTARQNPAPPYDLVFADPPYNVLPETLHHVLTGVAQNGWLAPNCLLVVETVRRYRGELWPQGVTAERASDYGDTRIWYGLAREAKSESHGEQE